MSGAATAGVPRTIAGVSAPAGRTA